MLKEQQAFTYIDQQQQIKRQQALARNNVVRPGRYQADDDNGEPDVPAYYNKPHTSIRAYGYPTAPNRKPKVQVHPGQHINVPLRSSAQKQPPQTEDFPVVVRKRGWFRSHPLIWLGLGMLFMLLAWTGLQALGYWWSIHQDDVTYGRPRTAQYDVVVGHNDSLEHKTHLIAMNLNSRVTIIELPGGDSSKAKIYQGPTLYGPNADLAPVTLSFRDTTGDGLTDMIVNVQGAQLVYLNKNGQFQQPQSH